jgi:hypothetical protein
VIAIALALEMKERFYTTEKYKIYWHGIPSRLNYKLARGQ